ncbi:MAG TPA: TrmJ/YjtD family RNA methyltransferase [Terriglobales bacterium]|nr:TrmJ/YjtD family RNA methyltransferase [Terriglobales bacterium]
MLNNELLRIVLVGTRNPLNIGAVARAMSNFGFEHLRVVNPYEVAFREARSAVGASEILASAEEYTSVPDAVADCELVVGTTAAMRREPQHPVMELDKAAAAILAARSRVALLFGSEKRGLSNHDLSYCQWLLHIPTLEGQPSMNLAQAVAVCLYELRRRPAITKMESHSLKAATAEELERLTAILIQALHASGYTGVDALPSTEEKVRRLIRRLHLSADDATQLLGMLRHIAYSKR